MRNQVASITLAIFAALWSLQSIEAHDGGHFGCVINGCPPGHSYSRPFPNNCLWTDPECGTRAVDGCDVRNQNAINFAGGFFPDYGVDICSSNRIVDCNQNELRGGGENSSINIWGNNNITIRNCRITNYMAGIFAPLPFSASFTDIQRNTFTNIHGCGGVCLYSSSNALIKGNTFSHTGTGGGIKLEQSNNANITHNVFTSSDGLASGISLFMSSNNFIGANNFTGDLLSIGLFLANNNKIQENIIKNNGGGISLLYSDSNVIHKNTITDYWGGGIDVGNSNFNNITFNIVKNGSYLSIGGINLQNSNTNNYIVSNVLENNYAGVWLLGSDMNTVRNNTILNNRFAGIWLRPNSNRNVIQNNTIKNNTFYGIFIQNSNNERVDWNYVCWNGVLDFSVNNSLNNNGTNNRCNRPDNWSDAGIIGCTFRCPMVGFPAGALDFGDAPDPPYASLLRNNGARHSDIGYEMLGTRVSADLDAKIPNLDEFDDGVVFPVVRPFSPVNLNVTVTVFDKNSPWYQNPLFLLGWFDWNNDGAWSLNEKAFSIRLNASTFSNNTVIVPVTFTTPQTSGNTTWARVRLSYRTEANVTGEVLYGEVEDYIVNVSTGPLLTLQGSPRIGTTMNLSLDDPLHPGTSYVLGMSSGTVPGIQLNDGRIIPLNFDILLLLSLQIPQSVGLSNNIGTLNAQGKGVATWSIPNVPGLAGNTFYFAFITLVQTGPPIAAISRSVNVTVMP